MDWWSICLSYFFRCFNSWKATSVYRGYFPAICRLCFLRSVHTFSWFLKSNWSCDFGHAETGNGAKSEWFWGVIFFRSNFKVEWENGVWTKIRFLGSGFLFTCGNFTLIFTVFSVFWIGFFLNGFPNPFTAHSRPNFLFELNFNFSLVVFLFTCGILTLILFFFYFIDLVFFK